MATEDKACGRFFRILLRLVAEGKGSNPPDALIRTGKIGPIIQDLTNALNCMAVNIPLVRMSANCNLVLIYHMEIPGS